jgi:hypothetical protein
MLDACTIAHHTGQTTDATTGAVTQTYGAAFYTGKCKVQLRDVDPATPEAGDRLTVVLRSRVDVPMSVEDVAVDDLVTITASVLDPDLVGRTFRVVAPFHGSFKTARRLPVEESP